MKRLAIVLMAIGLIFTKDRLVVLLRSEQEEITYGFTSSATVISVSAILHPHISCAWKAPPASMAHSTH